jgi:hypothetical protein
MKRMMAVFLVVLLGAGSASFAQEYRYKNMKHLGLWSENLIVDPITDSIYRTFGLLDEDHKASLSITCDGGVLELSLNCGKVVGDIGVHDVILRFGKNEPVTMPFQRTSRLFDATLSVSGEQAYTLLELFETAKHNRNKRFVVRAPMLGTDEKQTYIFDIKHIGRVVSEIMKAGCESPRV